MLSQVVYITFFFFPWTLCCTKIEQSGCSLITCYTLLHGCVLYSSFTLSKDKTKHQRKTKDDNQSEYCICLIDTDIKVNLTLTQ